MAVKFSNTVLHCQTMDAFIAQAPNPPRCVLRVRAGHFRYFLILSIIKNDFLNIFYRYFLILSIIKNDFLNIFYQVSNLFLHQSYLKSPLPVKLTCYKIQKIEQIKK